MSVETTSLAIVDAFAVIFETSSTARGGISEAAHLVPIGLTPEIVSAAQRAIVESLDDIDSPGNRGLAVHKSPLDPNIVQVSGLVNARNGLDANGATLFNAVLIRGPFCEGSAPQYEDEDDIEIDFSQLSPRYRH